MSEILDIVDENDIVIGQNTRQQSYINKTSNRIIFVCIKNFNGDILLQKRSKNCSFMPGAWDMSVWWHVSSWQTYEEAAYRELREEIWITEMDLHFISKEYWDRKEIDSKYSMCEWMIREESHSFFRSLYEWVYEWELHFDDGEVEDAQYFSLDEIDQMLQNNEYMTPGCIDILINIYMN